MTKHVIVALERGTSHETYLKIRDMGYLVVLATEFNIDTQLYEISLRPAGWKDT